MCNVGVIGENGGRGVCIGGMAAAGVAAIMAALAAWSRQMKIWRRK